MPKLQKCIRVEKRSRTSAVFVLKENHKLRSSATGIDGEAQGGPPRYPDAMAVVQGEAISLDFLKK